MYYLRAGVFLIGVLAHLPHRQLALRHDPESIRENEQRAISLGYSVADYKLAAFVMSAALAGLAGARQGDRVPVRDPDRRAWQMSGEVILMTLLGGIGT